MQYNWGPYRKRRLGHTDHRDLGSPREDHMRTEGKRQPCVQARDRGLGGSRLSALHPDLQPRALAAPHRARSHIVGTAARRAPPEPRLCAGPRSAWDVHTLSDGLKEPENVGLPQPPLKTSLSILTSKSACICTATLTCPFDRGVRFARENVSASISTSFKMYTR